MWIWSDNRYTCLFVISFFLSYWMSSPFSLLCCTFVFCVHIPHFACPHSSLLLSLCWSFIISCSINEHFAVLWCTVSRSKLTSPLLGHRRMRWLGCYRLGPIWKALLVFVVIAFAGQLLGVIFNKRQENVPISIFIPSQIPISSFLLYSIYKNIAWIHIIVI